MQNPNRYKQAEEQYFLLRGQLETGRITRADFETALKQLMVQDEQGRYWVLGPDSGKWYVHSGQEWVEANPDTGPVASAPVAAPIPTSPPVMPVAPRAPAAGPTPNRTPLVIGGIVALVLVAVIALALFAMNRGLLSVTVGPAPTATNLPVVLPTTVQPTLPAATLAAPTGIPGPTIIVIIPTTFPTESAPPTTAAPGTIAPTTAPTNAPSPTALAQAKPTTAPTRPPTVAPPPVAQPTVAATATAAPPTAIPPTLTPAVRPGLYVTDLRTEPSPGKRNQNTAFYPTFLNATGAPQSYNWKVYIYKPDQFKNSFGESTPILTGIPVGTSEIKSADNWRVGGITVCEDYIARVAWVDQNKTPTFFTRPDGSIFDSQFQMCP